MSFKTIAITCLVLLIQAFLFSLSTAYPFGFQDYLDLQDQLTPPDNEDNNWNNLPYEKPLNSKRDCAGFPCMYTHMAAKAGRASLYRTLARIIDECAMDPACNPGRRKRRSVSNNKWS